MSAITLISRETGSDRINRYRTRVKILVHSHNTNAVVDVSNSAVTLQLNKNIKSVGVCSFSLTGEKNWLNLIYPNDYVNVYVDRGDGQGWLRTFFGFVDHIEESVTTDANGIPYTSYTLQCSDFQKAFEKTQIYFNPHVAARSDFNGGFIGSPNIGGIALMSRGVRINGTPADLVLNVTLLLLGFGSQFLLPTSYNPRLADRLRQQRADFILNRLSEDARRQVLDAGGYAAFLENTRNRLNVNTDLTQITDPDQTGASDIARADRARLSRTVAQTLGGNGSDIGTEASRGSLERGIEAYNVLNTTLPGYPPTLLDIIDIFTFIEREAIDGYLIGAPLWDQQGNLLSFLRFVSNEVVNELFFDLRPVSRNGGLTAGTDFSRELDDISGNEANNNAPAGIMHLPAIVMREYPFSVIDRLDASDVSLTIREQLTPGGTTTTQNESIGFIYFGAIYSDQPNIPGRHVIHIPNINPDDLALGRATTAASKHIDVATVYSTEIITTKFSRSDQDHYNVFEFYSDAILGNDARFMMQDLLPIITPIHVVRHGLRVRSLTTRFGRFSLDTVNRTQQQPEQPPAAEETPSQTPEVTDTVMYPVDFVAGVKGYVSRGNEWHYRRRVNTQQHAAFNGSHTAEVPLGDAVWRFHNGVDIAGPIGEPVKAVRDGLVVCASPARSDGSASPGFDGYGGTVIIYHDGISPHAANGQTDNGAMFTLYAHLSAIRPDLVQGNSEGKINRMSTHLISGGRYRATRVHAGDVIGNVGRTGFRDTNMGPHLHLEVIRKLNNQVYPSMNRFLTPDLLTSESQKQSHGGWAPDSSRVSSGTPGNPAEDQMRSQDPLRIFSEWGMPLQHGRDAREIGPRDPEPPVIDDGYPQVYTGDAGEEVEDQPIAPSPSPLPPETQDASQSAHQVGHVDSPTTRRQIARWALLNDHWYQHNLEYLSGSIEMRGAPEIRVGYRLDLIDRNMSFYVEGVSHSWSYGKDMRTNLQVTRGQPNNPYPCYVLPHINGFNPTETQRQTNSRLSYFFINPDPLSVRRALKMDSSSHNSINTTLGSAVRRSANRNEIDAPDDGVATVDNSGAHGGTLGARYNENIIEAVSITADSTQLDLENLLSTELSTLGLQGVSTSTSAIQSNPQGGIEDAVASELFPTAGGNE